MTETETWSGRPRRRAGPRQAEYPAKLCYLRVTVRDAERLAALAELTGMTESEIRRRALTRYLDAEERAQRRRAS